MNKQLWQHREATQGVRKRQRSFGRSKRDGAFGRVHGSTLDTDQTVVMVIICRKITKRRAGRVQRWAKEQRKHEKAKVRNPLGPLRGRRK